MPTDMAVLVKHMAVGLIIQSRSIIIAGWLADKTVNLKYFKIL